MLKYFMDCTTLEELKSTYRNLVMKEQQSVTVNGSMKFFGSIPKFV